MVLTFSEVQPILKGKEKYKYTREGGMKVDALATRLEIVTGDPAQDLPQVLFTDFVAWVDRGPKTTATYTKNLRAFAAWMLYACCPRPMREDIISYRDWLQSEHDAITLAPDTMQGWDYRRDANGDPMRISCKPATTAAYIRAVKMFFSWTAAHGLYPNIAQTVRSPRVDSRTHKKDALEPAQVLEIETSIAEKAVERQQTAAQATKDTAGRVQRCDEQGKRLRALYLLATNAGLRCIELSRATVRDFEQKGQQAYINVWGKGHSEADTKKALSPDVARAVREYLDSRGDAYTMASPLFVSTGNRSGGKRIAETTISTMLKQAMKEAGYNSPRLTAHSLRHTCGTGAMKASGGNLYDTQRYMRHSNPATTEIYLHDDEAEKGAELAGKLWDYFHGGKEAEGDREKVENIMGRMTPAQLSQLAAIAQAMA